NYDTLTLEQVHGAITYYVAHRAEVDAHLGRNRAKFEALRLQGREGSPAAVSEVRGRKAAVLRIRFQADADLRRAILKGVKRREPTVEFITAHDAWSRGPRRYRSA